MKYQWRIIVRAIEHISQNMVAKEINTNQIKHEENIKEDVQSEQKECVLNDQMCKIMQTNKHVAYYELEYAT